MKPILATLISVDELAEELARSHPLVLDVRWALGGPPGLKQYLEGHIPTARFVDLDSELAGPPGPGRHPLPAAEAFASAMRAHGVSAARPVVVYDASTAMAAARAWWLLRFFGHPQVQVLDGGYELWVRSGKPVERGDPPPVPPGDFVAQGGHMPLLDAKSAAKLASSGVLLDARAGERFRGELEPVDAVAGHIPGAHNLPTVGNVGPDGRFLAPSELRRRLSSAGVTADVAAGAYCGSGVTAAHAVLAADVAGVELALYVGSWSDWITDPSRPVATGAA
jgi:thiosulfate/3-mercaptopyruvate sulfurtransferase